jgi:hypothetical protein
VTLLLGFGFGGLGFMVWSLSVGLWFGLSQLVVFFDGLWFGLSQLAGGPGDGGSKQRFDLNGLFTPRGFDLNGLFTPQVCPSGIFCSSSSVLGTQ